MQKFVGRIAEKYCENLQFLRDFRRNKGLVNSQMLCPSKDQLISKCLFGVFNFFQKMNENKSTSSKVEFDCSFFGRNVSLDKPLEEKGLQKKFKT